VKSPITHIQKLSVVDEKGTVLRYTYDIRVKDEYLGVRTIPDVPSELAEKLRVGDELECNGVGLEGLEVIG
jgi:hypothetical protein